MRVMTDSGSGYRPKAFNKACNALGLRLVYTCPYTPKTNGKAERFLQSSMHEWAHGRAWQTSEMRKEDLPRCPIITLGADPTPA